MKINVIKHKKIIHNIILSVPTWQILYTFRQKIWPLDTINSLLSGRQITISRNPKINNIGWSVDFGAVPVFAFVI